MSANFPIPETRVLAIASHVVYGYVGNTMATFVMQSLGCDVAAMNTVHFSNHTGYRQFRGRRTPAPELLDLYTGLTQSHLTDFDMLISGYAPSADAVRAIGQIALDLRSQNDVKVAAGKTKEGDFFWILDPVMGDQGRLYVSEDVVPVYRELIGQADLILPNQFEAETLSGVKIDGWEGLTRAVEELHKRSVGHVVVTSVKFDDPESKGRLSCVGSTCRSNGSARLFRVDVPSLDCFFSGTGDMFAALMVVRMREMAIREGVMGWRGWMSNDEVLAVDLPLARAVEEVLGSMQGVLEETMEWRDGVVKTWEMEGEGGVEGKGEGQREKRYLAETKAAEVRVVRNVGLLREPVVRSKAKAVVLEGAGEMEGS